MSIWDFLLYVTLIILVLYVTRANNIWGMNRGTKKARIDVQKQKERDKKRKRALKLTSMYVWVSDNLGFSMKEIKVKDYQYRIERLNLICKPLERTYRPKEIHGKHKIIQLVGLVLFAFFFITTKSFLSLIFLVLIAMPMYFKYKTTSKIQQEDDQLERDFPDFFTIIYSKLVQGTRSRLAPTLNDYLMSLDTTKGNSFESTRVIREFVIDLRNNIEIYGDDSIAVAKLREKYNSVMIINFCNLATQSLRGVENYDKLLSFKLELNDKRAQYMKERADKMVAKGKKAIIVVYIILFEFILLSWYAKFAGTTGGVGAVFGK